MSDGFSYVLGNMLAVGSRPPEGVLLHSRFDVLVLCAWEVQPPASSFPGIRVMRVILDDSGLPPTLVEARSAIAMGREVARQLRRGRRVLVTCYKGRNRSGLVAGVALVELGVSARSAVLGIRRARGHKALSNAYFVNLLMQYGSEQSSSSATVSR